MSSVRFTDLRGAPRLGLTIVLFGIGLALIVWTSERLGLTWADVRQGFSRVGWGFGVMMALTLARFALRARAWLALSAAPIPMRSAVAAIISGDALGNITPLGLAASEPAKAYYLRRFAPPSTTLAALTAENFFYSVSVAIYVMAASAALLASFGAIDSRVALAGQLALGTMAAVVVAAVWVAWQKPTMASATLERLPFDRARALAERVRRFEHDTYAAVQHNPRAIATVVASETAFHALSLVECWLVFSWLTGVTSLAPALVFDGFNRVANILFKPIPGKVGPEESGTAMLAGAIGYAAADGFMLAVVRKVRTLAFAVIGLGLWVRNSRE